MFATVGLTEWIINDTCLVFTILANSILYGSTTYFQKYFRNLQQKAHIARYKQKVRLGHKISASVLQR